MKEKTIYRIFAILFVLAVISAMIYDHYTNPIELVPTRTVHPDLRRQLFTKLPEGNTKHPCYKYSIVCGGVWTPVEAGLSFGHQTTSKGFDAYVNYRKNGNIYWTKKKLHIAKGETLFTDGVIIVRARCGNDISLTAKVPTDPSTVDEELEEILKPTPELPPTIFTSTLTKEEQPLESYFGGFVSIGGGTITGVGLPRKPTKPPKRLCKDGDNCWTDGTLPPPITPVPEPASILTLGTGVLTLAGAIKKRYRG